LKTEKSPANNIDTDVTPFYIYMIKKDVRKNNTYTTTLTTYIYLYL